MLGACAPTPEVPGNELEAAAEALDDRLARSIAVPDRLADAFSAGELGLSEFDDRLRREIGGDPLLAELGVAFAPSSDPTVPRLYAQAVRRVDGALVSVPIADFDDYVPEAGAGGANWWKQALDAERDGFIGSLCDEDDSVALARYVRRVELPGPSPRVGIVYAHVDLRVVEASLSHLETGPEGYTWLAADGRYLVHEDRNCVFDGCSSPSSLPAMFRSLEPVAGPLAPARVAECAVPVGGTTLRHPFQISVDHSLASAPGWSLGSVSDLGTSNDVLRRIRLLQLAMLLVASWALAGTWLWLRSRRLPEHGPWTEQETEQHEVLSKLDGAPPAHKLRSPRFWSNLNVALSLTLGFAIVSSLFVATQLPADPAADFSQTTDVQSLRSYLDTHARDTLAASESLPAEVPTGVFVQSITFHSAKEVLLTGVVWQRYAHNLDPDLQRGFLMPESQDTTIEELSREDLGDETRIIWSFNVLLNQEFDHSRYPFGQENIWVQLWHEDFAEDVVLVPDLESYTSTRPSALSGLRTGLAVPGWEVERTFFGYRKKTYGTSFGHPSFEDVTDFPELHLNVIVQSEMLQPLVAYILPIVVILVLLFTILLLTSPYRVQADGWGFNAMNAVTAAAGFFLVAVFSHADLRTTVAYRGINYLEYFYFVTYVALVIVVVNALLVSLTHTRLLRLYNNALPKLLFWPVCLGLLYAATMVVFW